MVADDPAPALARDGGAGEAKRRRHKAREDVLQELIRDIVERRRRR